MLCRLCCGECLDFEDLYDQDEGENYIFKICHKYFPQEMEMLDKTLKRCSKIICESCWKAINEFNEFRERVIAQQISYCNSVNGSKSLMVTNKIDTSMIKTEGSEGLALDATENCLLKNDMVQVDDIIIKTEDSKDLMDDCIDRIVKTDTIDIKSKESFDVEISSETIQNNDIIEPHSNDSIKDPNNDKSAEEKVHEIEREILKGTWQPTILCNLCKYSSQGDEMFQRHIAQAHPKNLDSLESNFFYECDICYTPFLRINDLKKHLYLHTRGNFQCPYCSERFLVDSKLENHFRTVHFLKKHTCHICRTTFDFFRTYKQHFFHEHKGQIPETTRRWRCGICKSFFANQELLRNHAKNVCSKRKLISANKKRTPSKKAKQSLQKVSDPFRNVKNKLNSQKLKYICLECGLQLSTMQHLLRHKQEQVCQLNKFKNTNASFKSNNRVPKQIDSEPNLMDTDEQCSSDISQHKTTILDDDIGENNSHISSLKNNTKMNEVIDLTESTPDLSQDKTPLEPQSKPKRLIDSLYKLTLRCDFCEFSTANSIKLIAHYKKFHPAQDNQPELYCPVCEESMPSKYSLKKHYKEAHSGLSFIKFYNPEKNSCEASYLLKGSEKSSCEVSKSDSSRSEHSKTAKCSQPNKIKIPPSSLEDICNVSRSCVSNESVSQIKDDGELFKDEYILS